MTIANTRNTIIDSALELIGVKAADEDSQADDVQSAALALDLLVKSWQNSGAHLWNRKEATLFTNTGQAEYIIGGAADATDSFSQTTLSSAITAGVKTIPLTSTSGISVNDFLGVKLDDGTLNFSTVNQVRGTEVVVADAIVSAGASGRPVFFYTTKVGKALRIPDARRRQTVTGSGDDGQDIEMVQLGRIDYLNLPNKFQQGTPVQFYYNPRLIDGQMFLWPTPQSTDTLIKFTYYEPLDVFANSADAADFPAEWIEALVYNLAVRLAPRFAQPVGQDIALLAHTLHQNALNWDQGDESVFLAYGEGRGM